MYKTRSHVKPDGFKTYLFVLSYAIIFSSLMALFLFATGSAVGYGVFTYVNYALYTVQIVSVLYGIFSRRIRLGTYKYYLILLLLQFSATAGSVVFVLYKVAESLSTF